MRARHSDLARRDVASVPPLPQVCQSGTGNCELSSIPASQLSAGALLLAYVVYQIYSVAGTTKDVVSLQITIASAITVIYILLSFWYVEDTLIVTLRRLKRRYSWAEFIFRLVLLAALALMPNFVDSWLPDLLSIRRLVVSDYVVIYLIVIYLLFLLWDGIVYWGAPSSDPQLRDKIRATPKAFFPKDVVGFLLLGVTELLHFWSENVAGLALLVFAIYSAVQIWSVYKEVRARRFPHGLSRAILR